MPFQPKILNRYLVFFTATFMGSLLLMHVCDIYAQSKGEDSLPEKTEPKAEKLSDTVKLTGEHLLADQDCLFLVQLYDPSSPDSTPLGYCFHEVVEMKGIYGFRFCVATTLEPYSGVKPPFYGKKGHWGVEQKCDKARLSKKLRSKEVRVTNNPMTAVRMKLNEGYKMRLLRDDIGVWDVFQEVVFDTMDRAPKKK